LAASFFIFVQVWVRAYAGPTAMEIVASDGTDIAAYAA
jgi:hypothetical protein